MNEDGFIQAIRANPEDETNWVVYADWLQERGDVRGEYLRLQHDLKRIQHRLVELAPQIDPTWMGLVTGTWRVVLASYPPERKIHAIKLVRELTFLGLKEAKDLVESPTRVIKDGLSHQEASEIQRKFEEHDMIVVLEPSSGVVGPLNYSSFDPGWGYRLTLLPCPDLSRIAAVRVVREATGLGLQECLALVNAAPSVIHERVPGDEAARLRMLFHQAGLQIRWEAVGPLPPAVQQPTYSVRVTVCPPRRKRRMAELIRQVTSVGLFEARRIIGSLPMTIREGLTREEAERLRTTFEAEGIPLAIERHGAG